MCSPTRDARPAIVYCGTRKDTDAVAEQLVREGSRRSRYHAGMSAEQRQSSQEAFMQGRAEAVVATNAFGMGVDKADVRTVVHWALPTSLEAYYQEAGRGGRDGLPARALLLGARMDLGRLVRFIKERETTRRGRQGLRRAAAARRRAHGRGEAALVGHGELGDRDRVLLSIAERAGAVELEPAGQDGLLVRLTGRGSPRKAAEAIRAARNRGWDSYRSIERYMTAGERSAGGGRSSTTSATPKPTAASGRCCDVCDPDVALAAALAAPIAAKRVRSARSGSAARDRRAKQSGPPVDEQSFERLRAGATSAPKASRRIRSRRTPCSKTCCARRRAASSSC